MISMANNSITGILTVDEMGWHWDVEKLSVKDLEFFEKVNPSSSITFLRHLVGSEHCSHLVSDKKKFLACLNAVKQS